MIFFLVCHKENFLTKDGETDLITNNTLTKVFNFGDQN